MTKGHLWVIERALSLFDELTIVIAVNVEKNYFLDVGEREKNIQDLLNFFKDKKTCKANVTVIEDQYLAQFALSINASCLIRGLRCQKDFDYEFAMVQMNRQLAPSVETLYMIPPSHLSHLSSSLVKSLVGIQGWEKFLCSYVPENVLKSIREKNEVIKRNEMKRVLLPSKLPGVEDMDSSLLVEFEKMKGKKDESYKPRTRHWDDRGRALFTNRLFLEKSPYLLQHAHNPVNWFPWGEEAFRKARDKDQPVLLSVGYSTCHWCHIMEEESFEDLEIARFINQNYVPIKVDREERPDIDSVYMGAVQMITGRGGWPMTVWLTPDKQVFYGGTYFPPRKGDRGSSIGFLSLLQELKKFMRKEKKTLLLPERR